MTASTTSIFKDLAISIVVARVRPAKQFAVVGVINFPSLTKNIFPPLFSARVW